MAENNMTVVREALKLCVKEMCELCLKAKAVKTVATPCVHGCETLRIVKAALAAPPRNCERLSADQCKQIFKSEMEVYLPQEATDNDREIAQRTAYGVIDALFAPYEANEKGEADDSNG